jgi:hypothetical protein
MALTTVSFSEPVAMMALAIRQYGTAQLESVTAGIRYRPMFAYGERKHPSSLSPVLK